jgi:hypothetical protein
MIGVAGWAGMLPGWDVNPATLGIRINPTTTTPDCPIPSAQ